MNRLLSKRFDVSRSIRLLFAAIGFAALAMTAQLLYSGEARADSAPVADSSDYDWMLAVLNNNHIGDRFGQGASGNVAVNSAAGDNNLQGNLRVISGQLGARQQIDNPAPSGASANHAQTRIDGQAFAGSRGAVGVNQVVTVSNPLGIS